MHFKILVVATISSSSVELVCVQLYLIHPLLVLLVFLDNTFPAETELLWHLNRKKLPDSVQVASIHQRIDSFGLDRSFLKKTDQVNCPDAEDASASPSQPTKAIY